ncbi:hypothetical protein [Actinomadura macrotermitis]|uniref:Uncharacterized protein n=1 Tax=Actinomadura macrotermitis TaxID=2585200 RepID=A0A7K0C913_9ACTN|nr:hypothetical protein [Actinomadura macrotermitis]MQY09873.1 hypothetical protein [Actinomadura macrotermitis]
MMRPVDARMPLALALVLAGALLLWPVVLDPGAGARITVGLAVMVGAVLYPPAGALADTRRRPRPAASPTSFVDVSGRLVLGTARIVQGDPDHYTPEEDR